MASTVKKAYFHVYPLVYAIFALVFIYLVFSHLKISDQIAVPYSTVISALIYGLTSYYLNSCSSNIVQSSPKNVNIISISSIIYLGTYSFCLISLSLFSSMSTELFLPWSEVLISTKSVITLASSILICFFLPGYAIFYLVYKSITEMSLTAKILLSYVFSLLLAALPIYIATSTDISFSQIKIPMIIFYLIVLVLYLGFKIKREWSGATEILQGMKKSEMSRIFKILGQNYSLSLILGSLAALVLLSTYYLYGGTLIGDQWFSHGRSLLFISGSFNDLARQGIDELYPPFFSSLLSAYFSFSSVPTVNAYVAINFLNFVPILSFYYFCKRWISPLGYGKAAALACVLFVLSSGYGWIQVLNVMISDAPNSQLESLALLQGVGIGTFDIRLPNTFINVGHPDITTPLIIIALPAGFTMLGLIKEVKFTIRRKTYAILVLLISLTGVLSHDEYYYFIIVACLIPLLLRLSNMGFLYTTFMVMLILVIVINLFFPGSYYDSRMVFGIPLIYLVIVFTFSNWVLYRIGAVSRIVSYISLKTRLIRLTNYHLRLAFVVGPIFLFVYVYALAFLVWDELPQSMIHTSTFNLGQRDIPWFLYPMKFGISGLLGIVFLFSYLFRRFNKELFVFAIIALVAILAGPYYDEHRLGKYAMAALSVYASLLIFDIVSSMVSTYKKRLSGVIITLLVISSSLSSLLYIGYSSLGLENPSYDPFSSTLPRRHFPSNSEMQLFEVLHKDIIDPKVDFVTTLSKEYIRNQGLVSKLQGFVDTSITKFSASPLTLNATSLPSLLHLLAYDNTTYIVLPKADIVAIPSDVLKFISGNFPRVYESDEFLVLRVPHLYAPSDFRNSQVSVVWDSDVSKLEEKSKVKKVLKFEETFYPPNSLNLSGDGNAIIKDSAVLSETLPNGTNFIEGRFRILDDRGNPDGHVGIALDSGDNLKYISLGPSGIWMQDQEILISNNNYNILEGIWYDFKVLLEHNSTRIYLDGELASEFPNKGFENVTTIGINAYKNEVEFEPMSVSDNVKTSDTRFDNVLFSMIASSIPHYTVFDGGDFSSLANSVVILMQFPDSHVERYLDFVRNGGTLVIFGTKNIAEQSEFSDLVTEGSDSVTIIPGSGNANNITESEREITDTNSIDISRYSYGKGRVMWIGTEDILEAVTGSAGLDFDLMRYIGSLIFADNNVTGLNITNAHLGSSTISQWFPDKDPFSTTPRIRFLGQMFAEGEIRIHTPYIGLSKADSIHVDRLRISGNDKMNSDQYDYPQNRYIRNISIIGDAEIKISSKGFTYMPSISHMEYFGFSIPNGFDIEANLSSSSMIRYVDGNQTKIVNGPAQIQFQNASSDNTRIKYVPLIFRSPNISANGEISIQQFYSNDPNDNSRILSAGDTFEINGLFNTQFEHVDESVRYNDTEPITYLQFLDIQGETNQDEEAVRIPGDLSSFGKKNLLIRWNDIFTSEQNMRLAISVLTAAVVAFYLISDRKRRIQQRR